MSGSAGECRGRLRTRVPSAERGSTYECPAPTGDFRFVYECRTPSADVTFCLLSHYMPGDGPFSPAHPNAAQQTVCFALNAAGRAEAALIAGGL